MGMGHLGYGSPDRLPVAGGVADNLGFYLLFRHYGNINVIGLRDLMLPIVTTLLIAAA